MDTAAHSGWSTKRLAQGPKRAGASQEGYTIVELSIAVAIAGVLLVSAIGLVQNVLQTNRANESITLVTKAMAQIDKIWGDQPDYSGISLTTAGAANVFAGMIVGRDAATNAVNSVTSKFNRPIWVNPANNLPKAGLNKGYGITFAGVPSAVCADVVTAAAGGGVRGILITPEATPNTTTSAAALGYLPTDMSDAGVFTLAAGTVAAIDGSRATIDSATALGPTGCGTNRGTVALTFLNWK